MHPIPKGLAVVFFLLASLPADASLSQDAVRERLARTALLQAEKISRDWDPAQRDCAGFVRFLYRSSIRVSHPLWNDREGKPALFLTADELITYNFVPLGRDVTAPLLKTGDVLAFFNSDKPADEAWHLMVVLEPPARAPSRKLLIYHNGERGKKGAVRKVWLDDLIHTAEKKWRPLAGNASFMGVFRWKGWKELNEIPREKLAERRAGGDSPRPARGGESQRFQ